MRLPLEEILGEEREEIIVCELNTDLGKGPVKTLGRVENGLGKGLA